jgi:hypothetical protein
MTIQEAIRYCKKHKMIDVLAILAYAFGFYVFVIKCSFIKNPETYLDLFLNIIMGSVLAMIFSILFIDVLREWIK